MTSHAGREQEILTQPVVDSSCPKAYFNTSFEVLYSTNKAIPVVRKLCILSRREMMKMLI